MEKILYPLVMFLTAAFCLAEESNVYDQRIRDQMESQWEHPLSGTWQIEYRVIPGMKEKSTWYIKGTDWWVRLYPAVDYLEGLNTAKVYEIDAVALDQNYGVISFYTYGGINVVTEEPR